MKIVLFISASLLLLVFSSSYNGMETTRTGMSTLTAATGNNNQHNDSQKNCLPFCTCGCCSTAVVCTDKLPVPKLIFAAAKGNTFCLVAKITRLPSSVWHPPQLSV